MKRTLEPQLMEDEVQVSAYAEADFSEPHSHFIEAFRKAFGGSKGFALDLGCGPGDISFRFACAFPNCTVHGVDGSECMLRYARNRLAQTEELKDRLIFIQGMLPGAQLPKQHYDIVISNSLLHHLPDPKVLWHTVKHCGAPGAPIFIMDLVRPGNLQEAHQLVSQYASDEPEILQRDFFNSLLAAFSLREIEIQLKQTELSYLSLQKVSDRHITVSGHLK